MNGHVSNVPSVEYHWHVSMAIASHLNIFVTCLLRRSQLACTALFLFCRNPSILKGRISISRIIGDLTFVPKIIIFLR